LELRRPLDRALPELRMVLKARRGKHPGYVESVFDDDETNKEE
jgi:hypothetical protein